mgnify:CR=1 FL=1
METGIEVENLSLTIKALQELGADNTVIREAGYEASLIMLQAALPLIPVKTGTLKANAKPRKLLKGGGTIISGTRVPYANPIHWGWLVVSHRHKGKLKGGTYRGIKPQPFFSEALGYTKEQILRNYEKNMQSLIDRLPGAKK